MSSNDRPSAITKKLTANDTGHTGTHQAGVLVPKSGRLLAFFPKLESDIKNPRQSLVVYDEDGERWKFNFVYYNNAHFGGTRNEYRLTGMTRFIRTYGLKPGDEITLRRDRHTGRFSISFVRSNTSYIGPNGRLKLGSQWKEVKI